MLPNLTLPLAAEAGALGSFLLFVSARFVAPARVGTLITPGLVTRRAAAALMLVGRNFLFLVTISALLVWGAFRWSYTADMLTAEHTAQVLANVRALREKLAGFNLELGFYAAALLLFGLGIFAWRSSKLRYTRAARRGLELEIAAIRQQLRDGTAPALPPSQRTAGYEEHLAMLTARQAAIEAELAALATDPDTDPAVLKEGAELLATIRQARVADSEVLEWLEIERRLTDTYPDPDIDLPPPRGIERILAPFMSRGMMRSVGAVPRAGFLLVNLLLVPALLCASGAGLGTLAGDEMVRLENIYIGLTRSEQEQSWAKPGAGAGEPLAVMAAEDEQLLDQMAWTFEQTLARANALAFNSPLRIGGLALRQLAARQSVMQSSANAAQGRVTIEPLAHELPLNPEARRMLALEAEAALSFKPVGEAGQAFRAQAAAEITKRPQGEWLAIRQHFSAGFPAFTAQVRGGEAGGLLVNHLLNTGLQAAGLPVQFPGDVRPIDARRAIGEAQAFGFLTEMRDNSLAGAVDSLATRSHAALLSQLHAQQIRLAIHEFDGLSAVHASGRSYAPYMADLVEPRVNQHAASELVKDLNTRLRTAGGAMPAASRTVAGFSDVVPPHGADTEFMHGSAMRTLEHDLQHGVAAARNAAGLDALGAALAGMRRPGATAARSRGPRFRFRR